MKKGLVFAWIIGGATMSGPYFCSLEDGKGNIVGTSRLMVVH